MSLIINQNKIILGTVQMGLDYGVNNIDGKITLKNSLSILNEAYNAGIRTLDTAKAYGEAHYVIGEYHKKKPNQIFNIITKIPSSIRLSGIESEVRKYLQDLCVDQLNTLMFHSFDSYKSNSEIKKRLIGIKSDGLFKYLGVSLYTNQEMEDVISDDEIDVVQLPFNLLDNNFQRGELLKRAKEKGKIIHTRSTFLQGLFFKGPEENHPIAERLKKELLLIKHLSQRNQIPIADLALGYCLSQNHIDQVLIGVDSVSQLRENIKASKKTISSELVDYINTINIENRDLLNPSLWN